MFANVAAISTAITAQDTCIFTFASVSSNVCLVSDVKKTKLILKIYCIGDKNSVVLLTFSLFLNLNFLLQLENVHSNGNTSKCVLICRLHFVFRENPLPQNVQICCGVLET